MYLLLLACFVHIIALLAGRVTAAATSVTISGNSSHSIPPLLYGMMFEDINHSGDGGLYAELLQNRAFQQVTPNTPDALNGWVAIGDAQMNVVADASPISSALPNALQVTIPSNADGQVGFGNEGYYGIQINSSWTYNASFYYKFPVASSFHGSVTVALQGNDGDVYASTSVAINGSQTSWKQINVSLKPTSSPTSTANKFTVTFNGTSTVNQVINFAVFSCFPPTYKDRTNGLRIDLATALSEMKPSFIRMPGGNNLGPDIATRWIWDATIGSVLDRPGRIGDWGYINTDGIGLLEYLFMCEDLEIEPILAIWAGYSLNGETVLAEDLDTYIKTAINEINFVIGDASNDTYAAVRASLGRPEPFALKYVEVGNEDFFSSDSYVYRWEKFVTTLSKTFPQLHFIATTLPFNPILNPVPTKYDNHLYNTPDYFVQNAFTYDAYERDGTHYMQGEYAVTSNNDGSAMDYPTVQGSVAEAAYMIGFERNADIVFAAAYAPLLSNIGTPPMWTPNMISFDASKVYLSTSYYVQQLFSTHRGTQYLPSTLPTKGGTLHWSITRDAGTNATYFKVVNYDENPALLTFSLPFEVTSNGEAVVLTGPPDASNNPSTPSAVVPITTPLSVGQRFDFTAPAYSVSVITAFLK